jgi:hypothetical protein
MVMGGKFPLNLSPSADLWFSLVPLLPVGESPVKFNFWNHWLHCIVFSFLHAKSLDFQVLLSFKSRRKSQGYVRLVAGLLHLQNSVLAENCHTLA